MKKLTALLLAALMLFSVGSLASCGEEKGFDYRTEDLSAYVTLPDYKANKLQVDIGLLGDIVTEDEIHKEINDMLIAAGSYYKKNTEAGVELKMGDTVGIMYKGVLVETLTKANYAADGTGLTEEQIKGLEGFEGGTSESTYNLQLGSGSFIAGFEDALVGKKIGDKNVPLALDFPDDYSNADLKGKSVVFFVTVEYKLEVQEKSELTFKDQIYVTYEAVLDEADGIYSAEAEEKGLLTEGKVTELLTLKDTDQFHAGMILAFNALAEDSRFGTEFKFDEKHNVVVTIEKPAEEGETADITKEDRQVTVHYTVTVHSLCNVRYYEHDEVDVTGGLTYDAFCEATGISKDDYPTYKDYVDYLSEIMQLQRDIQKRTDLYKGAFTALVKKSKVDLTSEKMKEVIKAYCDEIVGNIDYMEIQVQTDNELYYNYYIYSLMNAGTTPRSYVLQSYGYTESDLDYEKAGSKLKTDAEEYVTERLVFWQFVRTENISLTDEEYHDGMEEYKKFYQFDEDDHEGHSHEASDFLGHLGITEEQLREALLWDKAAKMLSETYCDIHKVPVKEEA